MRRKPTAAALASAPGDPLWMQGPGAGQVAKLGWGAWAVVVLGLVGMSGLRRGAMARWVSSLCRPARPRAALCMNGPSIAESGDERPSHTAAGRQTERGLRHYNTT